MATPIKSNANQVQAVSPVAADLLAKLQTQSPGESSTGAFNAWMEKHAMSAEKLQATADRAKPASQTAPSSSAARDANTTAARLLEQAVARSRQQAQAAAARQLEQSAAQSAAASRPATPPKAAKAETRPSEDKSVKSNDADTETEEGNKVKAKEGADDGTAIVNELTPPPEVKTDDAQAMMAWLASLTHGDMGHTHKALPKGGGQSNMAADQPQGTAAVQPDASRTDATQAGGATTEHQPADLTGWQAMQPATTAMLQAEGARSFKDELTAQGGARQTDSLAAGMNLRVAPEFKGAEAGRPEMATLQAPVGSDAFAQALSDQVTMWVQKMPEDGSMSAELHLNPADLGPIHVKISLEGKDAQVDFAAAAVETRQAIEASMNALSTALSDVGLNLTGGDVSAQTSQQGFQQAFSQSGGGDPSSSGGGRSLGGPEAGEAQPAGRLVNAPRPGRAGGLDLYA